MRSVRLVALVLCAVLAACSRSRPPGPRNALVVIVDTLRANRLSCYGYPRATSPNIDTLAARGTLYENNYSQGCWTVPSMISLMGGRYVATEEHSLPADIPVLAESLQAGGLVTAAFVGNPVLTGDRGFQRGFDHFEGSEPNGRAVTLAANFRRWYAENRAEIRSARGFFAWVHPMDPHHPYEPPQEYRVFTGKRPDDAILRERWRAEEPRVAELSPNVASKTFRASVNEIQMFSNLYDGEVKAVDDGVGQLLAFLEEEGELADTLVVFAADHGEMLWEHLQYPQEVQLKVERDGGLPWGVKSLFGNGHRAWFHQDLWNTPLILAGPGIPSGVRRTGLAANLDLFPTLLEAFDVPRLPGAGTLEGQSLWGGREPEREHVFGFGFDTAAVRERGGLKLIEHNRERFLLEGDGPRPLELFDLTANPGETADFAKDRAADAERLRAAVEAWRSAHGLASTGPGPSERDQAALEDLGYGDHGIPETPAPTGAEETDTGAE